MRFRISENGCANAHVAEYRPDLGPCWLWTAAIDTGGYGRFAKQMAHRVAYELLIGPIPKGLQIDHLCRVHTCVNPAHLEPVTQRMNLLRGFGVAAVQARRTSCIHGHPFDEENSYIGRDGGRRCRACHRERSAVRYRASAPLRVNERCTETLEGPARPSGVVLWRRKCKRRTSHPSKKCWQHRGIAPLPEDTSE